MILSKKNISILLFFLFCSISSILCQKNYRKILETNHHWVCENIRSVDSVFFDDTLYFKSINSFDYWNSTDNIELVFITSSLFESRYTNAKNSPRNYFEISYMHKDTTIEYGRTGISYHHGKWKLNSRKDELILLERELKYNKNDKPRWIPFRPYFFSILELSANRLVLKRTN